MDKPTHADIWQKLGRLEEKMDGFGDRLTPLETFARDYQADKNRILGAVAAIAMVSVLIVSGFKAWVSSWFPGASG